MISTACDWELDVERGPNWLFVRVGRPTASTREMPPLDDRVRALLEQHFTTRLVLELDQLCQLSANVIGQLLALEKWIRTRRGVMRLCGLSPQDALVLQYCGLTRLLPLYPNRREAVLGSYRPTQPR